MSIAKETAARAKHIRISMATTHHLFVLMISTKGLQNGLITHGRYSHPVYRAMSALLMPSLLNIVTDMTFTAKYGSASAKYSDGTQDHGVIDGVIFLIIENLYGSAKIIKVPG